MCNLVRSLVLASLLGLAACGGDSLTRTFGLTRDAPDEFQVTTRAPLSMPPDLSLRPPRPGSSRPQELTQQEQAEATLAPGAVLSREGPASSPGQQALLAAAGPPAPTGIRGQVNNEAALDAPSRSFSERLMFWQAPPTPGTLVDAERESQRLRQNAALGQPGDAGDTPIIQRRRPGLFSGLF